MLGDKSKGDLAIHNINLDELCDNLAVAEKKYAALRYAEGRQTVAAPKNTQSILDCLNDLSCKIDRFGGLAMSRIERLEIEVARLKAVIGLE